MLRLLAVLSDCERQQSIHIQEIAQMDHEHNSAHDVDMPVRDRVGKHDVHGADAFGPFDWKEGRTDQVLSNGST